MAIPVSSRSKIAQALLDIIAAAVPEVKYLAFDIVRLAASDFQDHELPAVQMFDAVELADYVQRSDVQKGWSIIIEVVVGPTSEQVPSQKDLWDLMQAVEMAVTTAPRLGPPGTVPKIIHAKLVGSQTDLHLMKPFYVGRIEIQVQYLQGQC